MHVNAMHAYQRMYWAAGFAPSIEIPPTHMFHAQGGAGGGFPFNMQSIFEQIFRDDPQYGAFFRGEAIVETTIQLSFMVRRCGL